MIKKYLKKFLLALFAEEIKESIEIKKLMQGALSEMAHKQKQFLEVVDVSVDVHQYGRSWACISIQGRRDDFVKFVDLRDSEIREIQRFLHQFSRKGRTIDAPREMNRFLKFS